MLFLLEHRGLVTFCLEKNRLNEAESDLPSPISLKDLKFVLLKTDGFVNIKKYIKYNNTSLVCWYLQHHSIKRLKRIETLGFLLFRRNF